MKLSRHFTVQHDGNITMILAECHKCGLSALAIAGDDSVVSQVVEAYPMELVRVLDGAAQSAGLRFVMGDYLCESCRDKLVDAAVKTL